MGTTSVQVLYLSPVTELPQTLPFSGPEVVETVETGGWVTLGMGRVHEGPGSRTRGGRTHLPLCRRSLTRRECEVGKKGCPRTRGVDDWEVVYPRMCVVDYITKKGSTIVI